MTDLLPIEPKLFSWARERSGRESDELESKFPKLREWEHEGASLSVRDLEAFATATYTPVGFLLLDEPPTERLPLEDFRTQGSVRIEHPSAALLETLAICSQRQAWYRAYQASRAATPVPLVGALRSSMTTSRAAALLRKYLRLTDVTPAELGANRDPVLWLGEAAEAIGVLVMINGVVADNTHRRLNPAEFRGFALSDALAPLVFVNGADAKTAQLFTLAHELAHIGLGRSSISNPVLTRVPSITIERWCNAVAAEFLLPRAMLERDFNPDLGMEAQVERIARAHRVSKLVVLRSLLDAGKLSRDDFTSLYVRAEEAAPEKISSGGNYFNTKPIRVGRRFGRSLIEAVADGWASQTEALELLEIRKIETLRKLSAQLGLSLDDQIAIG